MSENKENIAPTQVDNTAMETNLLTEVQTKLNISGVKEQRTIVLSAGQDKKDNLKMLQDILKVPEGTRFAGTASASKLPADISEPFEITIDSNIEVFKKVSENTSILDKDTKKLRPNISKLPMANIKFPVKCFIPGKNNPEITNEYTTNLHLRPENAEAVAELLQNKTAKGYTTHWLIDGVKHGKLEIVTGKETAKPEKKGAEMEEPTTANQ